MSNPTYDFEGQVALVTGASSGMGLATAHAFADAGASLVLADINEDTLHSATESLATGGYQALVLNARETRWWDREGRGVAGDFDGGPWNRSSPRGLPVEGRSLDSSRAELA